MPPAHHRFSVCTGTSGIRSPKGGSSALVAISDGAEAEETEPPGVRVAIDPFARTTRTSGVVAWPHTFLVNYTVAMYN